MAVRLQSIRFVHDAAPSERTAVPTHRNARTGVTPPEWWAHSEHTADASPVVYTLRDLARGSPVLLVTVTATSPALERCEVRAIQPAASAFTFLPEGANFLGSVSPTVVEFRSPQRTTSLALSLEDTTPVNRGVGAYTVVWQWQYRVPGAVWWTDLVRTVHRVLVTLSRPQAPWTDGPGLAEGRQLLWTDVVEVACAWARGARTEGEAASRITERIFGLGGAVLRYGCPTGTRESYANSLFNLFDCSAFLERLRGGWGNGPYVNCSDCAAMVSTFANALGCGLWQSRMGEYLPHFHTNPLLAIGTQRLGDPCGSAAGFSFHEVAWRGSCSENDAVFDACLAVGAPVSPYGPVVAVVPTNAPFGFPGQGLYRDWLAAPDGRQICRPRPQERRQRLVF